MKARRFLTILFLLAIFLLMVAALHTFLNDLHPTVFARWRSLGEPPYRAASILGLGTPWNPEVTNVYIEAENGVIYHCCSEPPSVWSAGLSQIEVLPVPCPEPLRRYYPRYPDPPGQVVDCSTTWSVEYVTHDSIYVLVDSGTLWRLEYYYGVDTFILIWLASAWISLALIAGALILVSSWRGRRRAT